MTGNEYQELASRTAKQKMQKREQISDLCLGLAGETGELIDYVKKGYYHRHGIQKDKIKEEIGDIMWYVSQIAAFFEFDLSDIMLENIEKLKLRYPEGFTVEASKNRKV